MHETANEPSRLQALRRYDVLDTPPAEAFDRLTAIAARYFAAPMALVSFVDADRQWFKSRVGIALTETPRDAETAPVDSERTLHETPQGRCGANFI